MALSVGVDAAGNRALAECALDRGDRRSPGTVALNPVFEPDKGAVDGYQYNALDYPRIRLFPELGNL